MIPRFRCKGCWRTFSQSSFAATYYLKRPELFESGAAGLVAASAHRQLGRSLKCAPNTVTLQLARLGRHALLFHALSLEALAEIREPVVYDDFETFCVSQDLPCGMGTAVGQHSWFVYAMEWAPHRRAARRSARKTKPRHPEPRPEAGAYRKAFRRTLDLLLRKRPAGRPLRLVSDGHSAYREGLRRHPRRAAIEHRTFPNPRRRPSPEARERDRQMFAADLLHLLMRHSLAHHRRETIAFGRRLNALLERGFLLAIWRNWIKSRSERGTSRETPAMRLGLTDRPWTWKQMLSRRLFPWKVKLPPQWEILYRRALITPEIGVNRPHALINAY